MNSKPPTFLLTLFISLDEELGAPMLGLPSMATDHGGGLIPTSLTYLAMATRSISHILSISKVTFGLIMRE